MTRDVYRYILSTYGRRPGYWISLTSETIRSLLTRVVLVIVVAHLASDLALHQLDAARNAVYLFFLPVS